MSLKVEIQKDPNEYKPKIFAGLTMRTLVCLASAVLIAIAIGAYSWWVLGIPSDVSMYVVIAATVPFWLAGFWRPMRMEPERYVVLWLRRNFGKTKLFYESLPYRNGIVTPAPEPAKTSEGYRALLKKNKRGFEAYRPTDFAS